MKNQYLFYGKVIAVAAVLVFAFSVLPAPSNTPVTASDELKKFASAEELNDFLSSTQSYDMYYASGAGSVRTLGAAAESQGSVPTSAPMALDSNAKSTDFSSTNIQVSGVDESDFVKNDDKYIYKISGSEILIVDAYPAETMKIVSTINLSGSNPSNLYVSGNRLVVIGNEYNYGILRSDVVSSEKIAIDIMPPRYSEPTTYVKIYDITDRTSPVLARDLVFNGSYYDSRMVGDYLYSIINVPAYQDRIPVFSPYQTGFPDIYYFPIPDYSYQYTNIISVNVKEDVPVQNKVFMLGYSTNLFVSQDNIYMVYQKQLDEKYTMNRILDEAYLPLLPQDVVTEINAIRASAKSDYRKNGEIQLVLNDWMNSNPEQAAELQKNVQTKLETIQADFERERDKSVIHKVSISNGNINYIANGEVPGTPLNQFSMDENSGFFRIATTTNSWREEPKNNLYVLDGSMSVVGKLEDLAKGERIYSARFLGNRAYLVTFVRMDPLFVIDLSDPTNPAVLGELKIPGVSEYLHPYDENTIIGIGQSTEEIKDRVTFAGLKISLFDVSDVANPVEKAKYEIGDQGTYSEALYDHKAVLFDKDKNLLVIPISVYEKKDQYYPQATFNGAHVFTITPSEITLKGRITHTNETEIWNNQVRRSLFMDNVLYTISDGKIKANSLTDVSEISSIDLPVQYYYGPYYYAMGGGVSGSSGILKTVDEVPAAV
jgi:inhibitor of cysteine peptidase